MKKRVFTKKGPIDIDLHRAMIDLLHKDLLAFGRRHGVKTNAIIGAFIGKYDLLKTDKFVLGILQDLEKQKIVKTTEKDGKRLWSLRGEDPKNWRLPFDFDPKKQIIANRHKRFICKVSYTKKGQAKITLPKPVIDNLAKPEKVEFYIEQDHTVIRQLT